MSGILAVEVFAVDIFVLMSYIYVLDDRTLPIYVSKLFIFVSKSFNCKFIVLIPLKKLLLS